MDDESIKSKVLTALLGDYVDVVEPPDWSKDWSPAGEVFTDCLRVAHLADLHLGRRWLHNRHDNGIILREQDLYDSAALLIKQLEHDRPHLIALVGDIFNTMEPSALTYMHAFKLIQRMQEIAPVYIIAGNHDHKRSRRLSPLVTLRDIFDCYLALDQTHVDFTYPEELSAHIHQSLRIHCLPYLALENHADGREELKAFAYIGNDILCAHGYAYGDNVSTPPEHVLIPEHVLDDPRFGRVLLGHIHQHVQLSDEGNAYYSGPLQPLDFGESKVVPGYWIHNQDKDGTWITQERLLPYRSFVQIELDQGELSMDEFNQIVLQSINAIPAPEGAIGKIILSGCDSEFRTSALPQGWIDLFVERGGVHLELDLRTRASEELLGGEYSDVPSKLDEAYYAYVKKANENLLAKAKQIMKQVDKQN